MEALPSPIAGVFVGVIVLVTVLVADTVEVAVTVSVTVEVIVMVAVGVAGTTLACGLTEIGYVVVPEKLLCTPNTAAPSVGCDTAPGEPAP